MPWILAPFIPNMKRLILQNSKMIEDTLSLLLSKEIISQEEKEEITDAKEKELDSLIFNKVNDLDEFLSEELEENEN